MRLRGYKDVQAYLTDLLTSKVSSTTGNTEEDDSESAPHGAFWNTLSYDEFVNGSVPGVVDPDTGQPMPVLVKGESARSNLILALRGAPNTPFDPTTGAYGQMPADGPPFLTADEIQPLADWIDSGCPE